MQFWIFSYLNKKIQTTTLNKALNRLLIFWLTVANAALHMDRSDTCHDVNLPKRRHM